MLTAEEVGTAFVVTANVATVLPAGIVVLAGTLATAGVPLARLTMTPPEGAG